MFNIHAILGTAVSLFFTGTPLSTPVLEVHSANTGGIVVLVPTVVEVSPGLFKATYTFSNADTYFFMVNGVITGTVEVESSTLLDTLKNLEDEALGSWVWNKTTGVLSMVRQTGTPLATFNVIDTLESSSRERIS